jgi:anti-sigma factor RsiW
VNASVCSRLADLLRKRDDDRLSLAEERLLSAHLASCDACAAEALRHDPVLLFARDAARSAPDVLTVEARERFVGDVLAATAAAKAGRRLTVSRAGIGLRIAATLLLAASVVGGWYARGRVAPSAAGGTVPVADAAAARPVPAETLPTVEEVGAVGAVVYQFPASKPGEPTVVFVVDRNADI